MTISILAGLGVGLGFLSLGNTYIRERPSLRSALEALDQEAQRAKIPSRSGLANASRWRWDHLLGSKLAGELDGRNRDGAVTEMLKIAEMSLDRLCAEVILGCATGVILPVLWWAVVSIGGLQVSILVPLWSAVVIGTTGGALPFVALRLESAKRRRVARRAVGSFLDLVVLCLAGGMGIEGALHASAQVGKNETSRRIAASLAHARDTGVPPWHALSQLGQELGVSELSELAAAVGLAGTEGARIRSTLTAKATSLRRHELADAEAQANTVTQRLFLPGVFLLVGFLLFIGYPAVVRIMSGL